MNLCLNFNLNLAALKYRNILTDSESPIKSITYMKYPCYPGHNFFALLKDGFGKSDEELRLYAGNGGTGTSFGNKWNAYNKAISEAIEIWAFYFFKNNFKKYPNQVQYGFNIDSSSSGMACFPGLVLKTQDFLQLWRRSSAGLSLPGGRAVRN